VLTTAGVGCALLVGLWQAGADSAPAWRAADEPLADFLSGIDFVPNRPALDGLMGETAPAELIAIARGRNASMMESGLRLRAYRALALYPSTETEAALRAAVVEHGALAGGIDTLYARAAMESLAHVAPDGSVATLAPMLAHPSQDVRAGAALALRETGSPSAIPALRARLPEEPVLQVRLAIADALNELNEATEGTN